jgi:uncharacterized tellurite resistance protein B-like protein
MANNEKILEGHSDLEKGAYLGAIASIATADRQASEEEMEYISKLCEAADLSPSQKTYVLRAATELSSEELTRCLDILKKSDLRFSLITDLMAFAKSDENYSGGEQENIKKISVYLGVNEQQFSLLDEFAEKTKTLDVTPQESHHPYFLSSLGLRNKLQNAGINGGGLLKGLIGFAAPVILSGLLSGGRQRSSAVANGNMSGGLFGSGGLGSLTGMLSGGRGFGSTGGLLGKILSRSF